MADLHFLLSAVAFSAEKHRHQRRKGTDASPYINHPIAVAYLLADRGGITDPATLVAAVLHDTIEDTDTRPDEITALFGPVVQRIVLEVTDDKARPRVERKQLQIDRAPGLSVEAKLIKLADKTCNVRDLTHDPPQDWPLERCRDYLDWAERVVAGCRGVNPALERAFEAALAEGRRVLGAEA